MENPNLFWADILLVVHFAYVLAVILPVLIIPLGAWRGWNWVRNRWFRWLHLAMIAIVAGQAALGIICPLTTWETQLRVAGGDYGYETSFIAHWVSRWLYFEAPLWVFAIIYLAFLAAVVALYVLVPPRRKAKNDPRPDSGCRP